MLRSIETPAPQAPGRAAELTHFSRGFNALTVSIPRGQEKYQELTFL